MAKSELMGTLNNDWGARVPSLRFVLDQERLQAVGLDSNSIAQQLQFLLSGVPVTTVREDIRTVQVVARAAGAARLDPARLEAFTLAGASGQRIQLASWPAWQLRDADGRADHSPA